MDHLSYPESYLLERGGLLTAGEIEGQPGLWDLTKKSFFAQMEAFRPFWQKACAGADEVILTGAGTSSFIGLSLEGLFFRRTGLVCRAVPTTHIVSHPENYFSKAKTPLIVSFARSGNSPESCAALEAADAFSKGCFHLIITCDGEGSLAMYRSAHPVYTILLPPGANDKGLAMTGSYSSMLLTGLLAACHTRPSHAKEQTLVQQGAARGILTEKLAQIRRIASVDFKRAVFLGSGELFGTAEEAALKLQELTDGKIICKADTYLGFRHGPKAVIDAATLVVYFFNGNEHVRRYETDLLRTTGRGTRALFQLGISACPVHSRELDELILLEVPVKMEEDFMPLSAIVPAQLLAFFKSLQLGLSPDNPSVSGAISRVVEGVKIYPFTPPAEDIRFPVD